MGPERPLFSEDRITDVAGALAHIQVAGQRQHWDLNLELSDSRAWTEEASLILPNSIVKHFGLAVPNLPHLLLLRRQGCGSPRGGRGPELSAKLCHSGWNPAGGAVSSSVGAQDCLAG